MDWPIASQKSRTLMEAIGFEDTRTNLDFHFRELRSMFINWTNFCDNDIITKEDSEFIKEYIDQNEQEQSETFAESNNRILDIIFRIMFRIDNIKVIEYMLFLIDDIIKTSYECVRAVVTFIYQLGDRVWERFVVLIDKAEDTLSHVVVRVIAHLHDDPHTELPQFLRTYLLHWIGTELSIPNNDYFRNTLEHLKYLVRNHAFRKEFHQSGLDGELMRRLVTSTCFQDQYLIIYILYLMCHTAEIAQDLYRNKFIVLMIVILKDCIKQKVIRIILITIHHIMDQCCFHKDLLNMLINSKVFSSIEQRIFVKFGDDETLELLKSIQERLAVATLELSTLDQYLGELKSGRLEWSPVHKSANFWLENAEKFTDDDCKLLRQLVSLIDPERDFVTLAIACHDIGEIIKHHPRGKYYVEKTGGKLRLTTMVKYNNPAVKYEALMAMNRLFVHNWERLESKISLKKKRDDSGPSMMNESFLSKHNSSASLNNLSSVSTNDHSGALLKKSSSSDGPTLLEL